MKQVFFYDESNHFDHVELVKDNAELPANATFVQPTSGLYEPMTWNGTTWTGATKEEWESNQPKPSPEAPSANQQFQAQLALQVADLKQSQTAFNSQVLLQLADLKKGLAVTDKNTVADTNTETK